MRLCVNMGKKKFGERCEGRGERRQLAVLVELVVLRLRLLVLAIECTAVVQSQPGHATCASEGRLAESRFEGAPR